MENTSVFLKRVMIGILIAILLLVLAETIRVGAVSHSYLAALVAGGIWAGGLALLLRRRPLPGELPSWVVGLVMGLCFVLNLAWVLLIRINPFSDYLVFWQTAAALASGAELQAPWYLAMFPHILGTATFLSFFLHLFGQSVQVVTVINVVLTTLSCLLIYGIVRRLCDRGTALLAALLWTLCPCKLMLNSLVFSEPLYTCLILLYLYLLICLDEAWNRKGGSYGMALLAGIALGLLLGAIQCVRPIAAILIIALVIWIILLRGRGELWSRWLLLLAVQLAVYVLAGKLWDRHIEAVLGMPPASIPIYNIYVGLNETTRGQWCAEDMDLLFAYYEQSATATEAQLALIPHLQERLAAGIRFPALFADKLFAFLGNDELGGYTYRYTQPESFYKPMMLLCNVFYYGILLSGLAGLAKSFRSRTLGSAQLLPLFFLGLTLAHMLVEVTNRYHYSLIPLLIIFAAVGLPTAGSTRRTP